METKLTFFSNKNTQNIIVVGTQFFLVFLLLLKFELKLYIYKNIKYFQHLNFCENH